MDLNTLRERLHKYIDSADERHLTALYVLLENQIADASHDKALIQDLYKRRENHLNGISKSYSVEESLELIRQYKR